MGPPCGARVSGKALILGLAKVAVDALGHERGGEQVHLGDLGMTREDGRTSIAGSDQDAAASVAELKAHATSAMSRRATRGRLAGSARRAPAERRAPEASRR